MPLCQSDEMEKDVHPIVGAFVAVSSVVVGGYSLLCSYIAFAGGTLPLLGWELQGGVFQGLLWLIVVTPVVSTVGYWICLLLALPLGAIFRSRK